VVAGRGGDRGDRVLSGPVESREFRVEKKVVVRMTLDSRLPALDMPSWRMQ
jgi:hypothetical protein